ncbi:MAG: hypothetical protein DRJ09_01615 [Bacteroidetes bacterium]|nr:MAG: hypothetical protein DRJ09_01615 [Bacteroidota bacterium]
MSFRINLTQFNMFKQVFNKISFIKFLIILVFIVTTATKLFAQIKTFRTYTPLKAKDAGKLFFHVESTAFLKNNEYFSQFAYGYTGIGIYFKPTLDYYFSNKLAINAGVYMLKYAGLDNLTQAIPVFTIRYKPAKTFDIIMGNIYGTSNHRLAEPLFRYDLFYQHHIEYGLQFLWNTKHFKTDLWLNWRHFIQLGDTMQEKLTVGSSSSVILYDNKSIKVVIPVQLLINHQGGQLAPPPRPGTTTIINGYIGTDISFQLNESWYMDISENLALYDGLSFPSEGLGSLPAKKGWGSYSKVVVGWKSLHWLSGYWHGENFIAPLGETQFQSISEIDPLVYQRNRNLITGKLWYNKTIMKGAVIEARFETYYDIDNRHFDYSYGLWLRINSSFFLTKSKAAK